MKKPSFTFEMTNEGFSIEKPLIFVYNVSMRKKEEKGTLNEVWTILKAVGQSQKELSEAQKELSEAQKETDRQLKETGKQIEKVNGHFDDHWGKLMEALVKGDILKLLQERGIKVDGISKENRKTWNGKEYEFDIIAVNGDEVVVTEVKTTLTVKKIDKFLEKLKVFKKVFSDHKNRTIYGAVAYLRVHESSDKDAESKGLFVIRATGSSASIINDKNFKPKVFG